jgi:ABC-type antimicrobial peptide transport system permease subunit
MSLDFSIKDLYRKSRVNLPYVLTISSSITVSIFLILLSTSLDLSIFTDQQRQYINIYFFSGYIYENYSKLSSILIVLIYILAIGFVMIIAFVFISGKKEDISIMKTFGTLPGRINKFYLIEVYLLFLLGFGIGLCFGVLSYTLFIYFMDIFTFSIMFTFNGLLILILFILCSIGCLIVSAIFLDRIGKKSVIRGLSKDIPYDTTAYRLKYISKLIAALGRNIKLAILNIKRRKGKFKRYFILFLMISMIIFTIGLGVLVLRKTSKTWVNKAQGEDIIIMGHKDVVMAYTNMYSMFSNPDFLIHTHHIDFTDDRYLFNTSRLEEAENINSILKVDRRLVKFCYLQELQGYSTAENGEITTIGENRFGNFPVIGIKLDHLIQFYETKGFIFTPQNNNYTLTIGDGLANNLFESPLNQKIWFPNSGNEFFISGIFTDTFYSGFASYMDLHRFQSIVGVNSSTVNIALMKIIPKTLPYTISQLSPIISKLGEDFICISLDSVFTQNENFIETLTINNLTIIALMVIVSFFCLYNFQRGDLTDKLKDFLIIRAIGSKIKNLRRILFFEGLFILIGTVLLSFAGGLIINSLFLFENAVLPPLYVPLLLLGGILVGGNLINYISILLVLRKLKKVSISKLTTF